MHGREGPPLLASAPPRGATEAGSRGEGTRALGPSAPIHAPLGPGVRAGGTGRGVGAARSAAREETGRATYLPGQA